MRIRTLRGIVAGAVVLCVAAGLVIHAGLGTPSAFGWRDIAAICPVGALEVMAGAKALLVHPALLLAAVLLIGSLAGKAFCSWVCPVPHVSSLFRPKGRVRKSEEECSTRNDDQEGASSCGSCSACHSAAPSALPPAGGKRDGLRIDSRHATLIGAVASSFAFGFPVFCLVCPVGLTFAVLIGLWNLLRFNEASWGLLIFPAIILLEVVFFRKWCTTFCPISALLSLVSAHSKTLRPSVDEHACLRSEGVDCTACVSVCPEGVDPHAETIPECSRCGECIEACPAHALSMSLLHKKPKTPAHPETAHEERTRK